VYAMNVETGLL